MPPVTTEQDLVATCRETLRQWPQARAEYAGPADGGPEWWGVPPTTWRCTSSGRLNRRM